MSIELTSDGTGYELDCGCFAAIEENSMAISKRSSGPLVEKWPYLLLIDCPYCGDEYCYARELVDSE